MASERARAQIEHQERDIRILRDLYTSRIMTGSHIAALHFQGRREAAKKRLQKLKSAGLIRERPRKAREQAILFLAKRGFDALHEAGALAELPALSWNVFERRANVSPITIRHELAVMDVKSALVQAIQRRSQHSIIEFTTWPLLCEFVTHLDTDRHRSGIVRVRPDGLLRVLEEDASGGAFEHDLFLEIDRGTETLETLAQRMLSYRQHYASGGFAVSMGGDRSAVADYPFRVLVVLPSEERRNNVAERLLRIRPAIETMAWTTTMSHIIADPLGAIWMRPSDYRQATGNSAFAIQPWPARSSPAHRPSVHRRQVDRELHVCATVRLQPLFQDDVLDHRAAH